MQFLRRGALLLILFGAGLSPLVAQPRARIGVAYYDLGGLYDTLPSPHYYDPYTPEGERHWTGERYRSAVVRFAALIDTLSMPLVGLYGVESEAVVQDLAAHSQGEYAWAHESQNRQNGLDFALLYHADRFRVIRVQSGAGWMSIEGAFDEEPLVLLLCHRSRYWEEEAERLLGEERGPLVVMGEATPSKIALRDGLARAHRSGRGNRMVRGLWQRGDSFYLSPHLEPIAGDIFLKSWLLESSSHKPFPLYERGRYRGGYGAKLPVFIYFGRAILEN